MACWSRSLAGDCPESAAGGVVGFGIRNAHGVTEEERAARRTTSPCPRCSHLSGLLEEALSVETEPLRRMAALDQLLRELHRLAAELHQGLARRQQ